MIVDLRKASNAEAIISDGKLYIINQKNERLITNPKYSAVFVSENSKISEFVLPIKVAAIFEFNDVFYDTEKEAMDAKEDYWFRNKVDEHDRDDFDYWWDLPKVYQYVVRHVE